MILFDLVKKLLGVNNVDEVTDEMITDYYNKTCNAMPEDTVAKPTEETPTETTVTDIPASDTPVVVETEIEEDGSKEVKATDLATGKEVKVTVPVNGVVPVETEKKLVVNACGDKSSEEKKVVNAGCEDQLTEETLKLAKLTEEDIKKAALNKSVAITKDYVDGLHGDDFFKFLHSNKDLVKEMYK